MCDSVDSWVRVEEVLIWIALQKEKEDLEDISNELELADEEDMIPYVLDYFLRPNTSQLVALHIPYTRPSWTNPAQ